MSDEIEEYEVSDNFHRRDEDRKGEQEREEARRAKTRQAIPVSRALDIEKSVRERVEGKRRR